MDNGNKIETVSFGGLGDSVIVNHKLSMLQESFSDIDHCFVESNRETLYRIEEYCESLENDIAYSYVFDRAYNKNYYDFYGKKIINTTWDGKYHSPFYTDDKLSLREFSKKTPEKKIEGNNLVIQVDGGIKSSRKWQIDPRHIAKILRKKYNVILVGTDTKYSDSKDDKNFVCKTSLTEALCIVKKASFFVGLSGFFNYVRHYENMQHVYLRESFSHDAHYYAPTDNDKIIGIDHASRIFPIFL